MLPRYAAAAPSYATSYAQPSYGASYAAPQYASAPQYAAEFCSTGGRYHVVQMPDFFLQKFASKF